MDTGQGTFAEISPEKARAMRDVFIDGTLDTTGVFQEGEVVHLRGSRFKIDKIKRRTIRLLLLPNE